MGRDVSGTYQQSSPFPAPTHSGLQNHGVQSPGKAMPQPLMAESSSHPTDHRSGPVPSALAEGLSSTGSHKQRSVTPESRQIWDDVALSSLHDSDRLSETSSDATSANELDPIIANESQQKLLTDESPKDNRMSLKNRASLQEMPRLMNQSLAESSKTPESTFVPLEALRPRSSSLNKTSKVDIADRSIGKGLQADGSNARRASKVLHMDSRSREGAGADHALQDAENISERTVEVANEGVGALATPTSDAQDESPHLTAPFSNAQHTEAVKQLALQSNIPWHLDGLSGPGGATEGPYQPRRFSKLRDTMPSTLAESVDEHPESFEEPKSFDLTSRQSRAFTNESLEDYVGRPPPSSYGREGTLRTVSSSSPQPLRMEDEDCSSITCTLRPDDVSHPSPEDARKSLLELSRTHSTDSTSSRLPSTVQFSPIIEPIGPQRRPTGIAIRTNSGLGTPRGPGSGSVNSQFSFRRADTDKFELPPNHPANKVFKIKPSPGIDAFGDAAALDAVDPAWADGPPARAAYAARDPMANAAPKSGGHEPDEIELANLEAEDKVPDRPLPRFRQSYSLHHKRHFSLEPERPFNLSKAHRRAPIARDWSVGRKRFTAAVACISTALMGMIIGIYAGEVPAIQYAIVDQHHQAVLGNVVFFCGLAIPTILLYPLPLLHGRKPYTLAALTILMPLQFPPAVIVSQQRSPDTALYRTGLLLSRALAGLAMGFANLNFFGTLLDLFGASLMSTHPHEEAVVEWDPRRHGGGMGIWLGIWTWCFVGSIGLGFFLGAVIISRLSVAWGFWISIILVAVVLVLNVVAPEVRRSAYRKSMAEVRNGNEVSRRVARGEIMMHLYATGPLHWWEEVLAGLRLNGRMLAQPGFLVMAVYVGWMYAQMVLVTVLLGALTSRDYRFYPQTVALCTAAVPIGALFAVPFQNAGLFSRARKRPQRTDSMTFQRRMTWSSHLVRRVIFMVALPLAGVAYTLVSGGPPMPAALPSIFAGLVGSSQHWL